MSPARAPTRRAASTSGPSTHSAGSALVPTTTGWTNSTATCRACHGHVGDTHHRVPPAGSGAPRPAPWWRGHGRVPPRGAPLGSPSWGSTASAPAPAGCPARRPTAAPSPSGTASDATRAPSAVFSQHGPRPVSGRLRRPGRARRGRRRGRIGHRSRFTALSQQLRRNPWSRGVRRYAFPRWGHQVEPFGRPRCLTRTRCASTRTDRRPRLVPARPCSGATRAERPSGRTDRRRRRPRCPAMPRTGPPTTEAGDTVRTPPTPAGTKGTASAEPPARGGRPRRDAAPVHPGRRGRHGGGPPGAVSLRRAARPLPAVEHTVLRARGRGHRRHRSRGHAALGEPGPAGPRGARASTPGPWPTSPWCRWAST